MCLSFPWRNRHFYCFMWINGASKPARSHLCLKISCPTVLQHAPHVQVHKGKLRTVAHADMPVDIRIAARRQKRAFSSWQLGLGPEVLYTQQARSTGPRDAPAGAPHCQLARPAFVMLAV